MTVIFRDHIGHCVYIYLNDIFIYSDTLEDHERHLRIVFNELEKADFYLEQEKCDLYAEKLDCLGHIIDHKGVHTDRDKMSRICGWRTPGDFKGTICPALRCSSMKVLQVSIFVGLRE